MNSLVLAVVSRLVIGLMLLFSLFLLWRGHNEPGGGFIGGLVAAAALAVHAMAAGPAAVLSMLRVEPRVIAGCGLGIAVLAGICGLLAGSGFLGGLWVFIGATETDKGLALGTPLLFDVGVYLAVVGGITNMMLALEKTDH